MSRVEILKQRDNHFLWIDDELWMWDVKEEVAAQEEIAQQAYGSVLVAGYGLGLVQRALFDNINAESVCTVELHEDVINECLHAFDWIYGEIIIGDFYSFESRKQYDCVIGDIWIDYDRAGNIDEYKKFKKKATTFLAPGGKILAWGQDYMEFLIAKEQIQ